MNKFSISLPGIRRTLDKIESVLARKTIDFKSSFDEFDPKRCGLVSDSKFFTVVYNQLGHEFGICQEEVRELADYFKKPDGRVYYQELLDLVSPQQDITKPYVTGLEWEDDEHVNVLTQFELRQLHVILTKIAYLCRLREVFLEPYFKDYESISCNNGTVTVPHFRRILNFGGITLGTNEFQLVTKRYMKHGFSINYVAFVAEVQSFIEWFDKHGFDKKSIDDFPEKVIIANVDKLPRPEIGKLDVARKFEREKACHPCVEHRKNCDATFEQLMLRIKKYILDHRIRTRQFFERFDKFKNGFITKSQFFRAMDSMGLSALHRFYIAPHDLEKIFNEYRASWDEDQFGWCWFCDDIDEVFTIKCLDKQPYRVVQSPPEEVKQVPRPGTADWDCLPKSIKQLAQETVFRIRNIIKSRRIPIETFFKGYDKLNHFHVSSCQMRRVFSANSILLSGKEVEALMSRYSDDMGFNYWKFQQEIDDVQFCEAKHQEIMRILKIINEKKEMPCSKPSFSIIEILAKIKNQVTRNRINIDQFLRNGEILNGMVLKSKFQSSFSAAGIFLDKCELDFLCKSETGVTLFLNTGKFYSKQLYYNFEDLIGYQYPCEREYVDYKAFCEIINQAFFQTKLEKKPCTVPVQFIPTPDDSLNFLNYEERCIVSHALQKLSRYHDDVSNMKSVFKDRGGSKGIISKDNLVQVFQTCGLMELVTQTELGIVFKCFSKPSGIAFKFDYENFLMLLARIKAM